MNGADEVGIIGSTCDHEYCWGCLADWRKIDQMDTDERYMHQNGCPKSQDHLDADEDDDDYSDYGYESPPNEPNDYTPEEPDGYPQEEPDHHEDRPPTVIGWYEIPRSSREQDVEVRW